jgi:sigma-B regulation protein RsbU (phosphoserine phosphatase)
VPGLFCGGDYYDVIQLGPGRYLMLVGDVEGPSVRGALVTGMLKAIIYPEYVRNSLTKPFSPGAFLSWLNDRLNFELRKTSGLLVCFFAGVLDSNDYTFTYANAGMAHPYLVRGGIPHELLVSGRALGFAASVMYPDKFIRLMPGDIIIAYSDGLVEFGQGGSSIPLKDTLSGVPYGSDFHKRIMDGALERADKEKFSDDVTIMTAKIE